MRGLDVHAADRGELGARHRLLVGDDRERLERRARQARRSAPRARTARRTAPCRGGSGTGSRRRPATSVKPAAVALVLVVQLGAERLDLVDRDLGELREQLRLDRLDRRHQHRFDRALGLGHASLSLTPGRPLTTIASSSASSAASASAVAPATIGGPRSQSSIDATSMSDSASDEPPDGEVAERLDLVDVDDALLVELEHGEEPHDDLDAVVDPGDERAEAHRRGAAQLHEQRVGGVAHADADRRHVVEVDLGRRRRRREAPDRGGVQLLAGVTRASGSGARLRNGSSTPALRETTLPPRRSRPSSTRAASLNVLHSSSRARSRSRSSKRSSSSSSSVISEPGQQAADLELHERRRDEQELGGDVEVDPVERLDLDEERVDDLGDLDVPDVHLLLQDEMEEELERPLVHRDAHGVGHRDATLAGGTRAITGSAGHSATLRPRPGAAPVRFPPMTRQFSGIQPTGEMHLGNFVGAVQRWVDQQDGGIFCVVDLHAMTMPYDPAELTAETRRLARPAPRRRPRPGPLHPVRAEPRPGRSPSSPGSSTAWPPSASSGA